MPLASDRPLSEGSEAKCARTWRGGSLVQCQHPGRLFETCGSTYPQVLSSHISSHLWARQSGTVRHGQRLTPLVAGLSGTVRDGQKRL